MGLVVAIGVGLLGLLVGSFLTKVIDRVPDKLAVLKPASRCPYCDHRLARREMMPVVSWLRLGGRCSYCDHAVTVAYPVVEIATSLVFVALLVRFGLGLDLIVHWIVASTLLAVSVVDLYRYRIPNRILFPALAAVVPLLIIVSLIRNETDSIGPAVAGAGIYFMMLFVPHILYPKGMGFGDVKLALMLGLILGWVAGGYLQTTRLILLSLILSSLLGVVGGAAVAVARRVSNREVLPDPDYPADGEIVTVTKTSFPFGPALATATLVSVLFTNQILGT